MRTTPFGNAANLEAGQTESMEWTDPLAGPCLERTDPLAGHRTMLRKERPDNRTDAGRTGLDWTEQLAGHMTRTRKDRTNVDRPTGWTQDHA